MRGRQKARVRHRLVTGPETPDLDLRHDVAVSEITISLDEDLTAELAQVAHHEGTTEADLIREGIERLLQSRLTVPAIPRFARRLGPLAAPGRHLKL
jgi:hypothetical protein